MFSYYSWQWLINKDIFFFKIKHNKTWKSTAEMAYVHFDILRKGNALYPNVSKKGSKGDDAEHHLPFWLEHAEPGYSNVLCL